MNTSPDNTRNLLGGFNVWAGVFPILNVAAFIAGWFTVTVEIFLRRDFGERYFNRMNFIAGLIVLSFFSFTSSVGSLMGGIGHSSPQPYFDPQQGWIMQEEPSSSSFLSSINPGFSAMTWVLLLYILVCGYHFFRIWWRNGTQRPLFSFYSGKSWLEPVGKVGMGVANIVVGLVVRFYALTLPAHEQKWLPNAMPVMRDERAFTERFIEPLLLIIASIIAASVGAYSMASWLIVSTSAIIFYTNMRLLAEDNAFLDWKDQIIESTEMREAMSGDTDSLPLSYSTKAGIWNVASLVEKSPETLDMVRRNSPSLADAMEALNPKLKNMGKKPPSSDDPGTSQQFSPAPDAPVPTVPVVSTPEPEPVVEEPQQPGVLSVADAIKNLKEKPGKSDK